ncbi:MAG: hypothetical protein AAFV59_16390 [Pseudomonadota bacterium]
MSITQAVAITVAMAAINVGGTLSLKQAATSDRDIYLALGIAAYTVGAVLYLDLMRGQSLAILSVATSILQLGIVCSLAVWMFNETVTPVQWLGLAIGMLSMAIVMLAAST